MPVIFLVGVLLWSYYAFVVELVAYRVDSIIAKVPSHEISLIQNPARLPQYSTLKLLHPLDRPARPVPRSCPSVRVVLRQDHQDAAGLRAAGV